MSMSFPVGLSLTIPILMHAGIDEHPPDLSKEVSSEGFNSARPQYHLLPLEILVLVRNAGADRDNGCVNSSFTWRPYGREVEKGDAGSPARLKRLHAGLSAQP